MLILFLVSLCFSVFVIIDVSSSKIVPAIDFRNVEYYTNEQCGEWPHCPLVDCRLLPPIVLGFCCGCKQTRDHVGIECPQSMPCPQINTELCHQYNLLMNCCC
ncbi:uncharacterized protein LOC128999454 [Macrosteles quadrilineatus]|uniref:uncharacterized protein LOC128999454 n=1 Tax=Macrosteles quadrilineatus TaxID=74068 RepID=UPI0023E2B805|nr:uncharacterized protein LOC128999454 [Macrosteles quadrilineatus]